MTTLQKVSCLVLAVMIVEVELSDLIKKYPRTLISAVKKLRDVHGAKRGWFTDVIDEVVGSNDESLGGEEVSDCPPDWVIYGSHCYFVPKSPQTDNFGSWASSRSKCQALHAAANLVSIQSSGEQKFIESMLSEEGVAEWDFWTSGNRLHSEATEEESSYYWHWGNDETSFADQEFLNWDVDQPQNPSYEQCLFLGHKSRFNHRWHDHRCSYTCSYICELDPLTGTPAPSSTTEDTLTTTTSSYKPTSSPGNGFTGESCFVKDSAGEEICYILSEERVSFEEANAICANRYEGSLAVIPNQEAFNNVQGILKLLKPAPVRQLWDDAFYVNAQRQHGGFFWKSAVPTRVNSDWWGPNEPNNYLGKENCVSVYLGGLNDFNCEQPLRFICERIDMRNDAGDQGSGYEYMDDSLYGFVDLDMDNSELDNSEMANSEMANSEIFN